MRARRISEIMLRLTALAAFTVAAAVMVRPSTAHAQVEYVRICEGYGAGFYFIPGTDVCLNVATGDAVR